MSGRRRRRRVEPTDDWEQSVLLCGWPEQARYVYGEEGLARHEAALWLHAGTLTVEHAGETLSRYDVEVATDTGKLWAITLPRLYETSHVLPQLRLFGLEALGEAGWLKALRLPDYAPRKPRRPLLALQEALFPYLEAL